MTTIPTSSRQIAESLTDEQKVDILADLFRCLANGRLVDVVDDPRDLLTRNAPDWYSLTPYKEAVAAAQLAEESLKAVKKATLLTLLRILPSATTVRRGELAGRLVVVEKHYTDGRSYPLSCLIVGGGGGTVCLAYDEVEVAVV